jgi:hypothetical protein
MDEPAEAAQARLSWSVRRDGEDLVLSIQPPQVQGERGFRPAAVAGAPGPGAAGSGRAAPGSVTSEPLARLVSTLARAGEAGGTVAIQGFAAPRPDNVPMTFTLAASLADIPYPEAGDLPDENVDQYELPCGPGVRVRRLARTRSDPGLPEIAMFTATYLAQTDHGVLALAFATPHVDAAPEFALLFDSIASSCTLQPAPPSDASAT